MIDRRRFIEASLLALTPLALARPGRAQGARGKRFVFLHAEGGWDPLCVFAPQYDTPGIDMEPASAPMQIGDLALVDHPLRPAVRGFFERHGARSVVLNGVSVRSVNHETCQAVALTGSTSDRGPDWATLLGAADRGRFDLPHIVFSGPALAGEYAVLVSRAQGALASLLEGRLLGEVEPGVEPLGGPASRLVDRFLARRAEGIAAGPAHPRLRDLAEAHRRAQRLSDRRFEIDLRTRPGTLSQAETAVRALAQGLCRCVSIGTGFDWDTHLDNTQQIGLFDGLFGDLDTILALLAATRGPEGRPLADDTLVVVTSEMARTPAYNATGGRDHWPYTSMLLVGPGITGGRVIGGYDPGFNGIGVDPATGAPDPAQAGIAAADLGATLLALGDVDPAELLPGARPITGIIG